MKEIFIEKMDAFTYRERIANDNPVILIPVGTVEQHGPHMPLSVDQLLPKKMSELVAK
ncbi:MAG: creatininase, partial [Gammaproteobacteria bacterium]